MSHEIEDRDSQRKFTLEELSSCSDVPTRTIRYYIQRGLVPRPCGEKKGAFYVTEHVDRLVQIRRWIAAGWSLDRIEAEFMAHLSPQTERPAPQVTAQKTVRYDLSEGISVFVDVASCTLPRRVLDQLIHQFHHGINQHTNPGVSP